MKIILLIGLLVLAGCQPSQSTVRITDPPDYEAITADAAKASHLFMTKLSREQQVNTLIPQQFWGEAITTLKPIRLEFDRVNVAIIMSETDDYEEGYYCCPMISSYWPEDKKNVTFTHIGNYDDCALGTLMYYRKHKNIIDLYDNTLDN